MEGLREWVTGEMQRLGFPGLEGVYDYLATMSDRQVDEYLQSLLGPEPEIQAFAKSYVENRAAGRIVTQATSHVASASSDPPISTWAGVGASSVSNSKKAKRGRGKRRVTSTNGSGVKRDGKSSFAIAVTNQKAAEPNSEQAHAIKNSPVEQVRQKVREYRKSKRTINCFRCGKIEDLIREDGACSFCQAPIFSMWERDAGSSPAQPTRNSSSKAKHWDRQKDNRSMPVVLGRYVFLPDLRTDGGREASLIKNIAGKDVLGRSNGVGADGGDTGGSDGGASGKSEGYCHNPNIRANDVEECCSSMVESLKKFAIRVDERQRQFPLDVQGRLQVDDISPNVCLYSD